MPLRAYLPIGTVSPCNTRLHEAGTEKQPSHSQRMARFVSMTGEGVDVWKNLRILKGRGICRREIYNERDSSICLPNCTYCRTNRSLENYVSPHSFNVMDDYSLWILMELIQWQKGIRKNRANAGVASWSIYRCAYCHLLLIERGKSSHIRTDT